MTNDQTISIKEHVSNELGHITELMEVHFKQFRDDLADLKCDAKEQRGQIDRELSAIKTDLKVTNARLDDIQTTIAKWSGGIGVGVGVLLYVIDHFHSLFG